MEKKNTLLARKPGRFSLEKRKKEMHCAKVGWNSRCFKVKYDLLHMYVRFVHLYYDAVDCGCRWATVTIKNNTTYFDVVALLCSQINLFQVPLCLCI